MRELSAIEARVLGVLVEKERTVPDAYPMSLNALASGCNQKTSRHPIMNASEAEILSALASLGSLSLVIESSGGRVMRYAQNVKRVLQIPGESVSLLAMLMLRGPQTAAELRANCSRLCRFSDVSAVEAFLSELAERGDGALVRELPRQAGSRETRWVHLLCGDAGLPMATGATGAQSQRQGEGQDPRQIDLPEVVAEVRAALARYERARSDRDVTAFEGLFWQSPKARQFRMGAVFSGSDEISGYWSIDPRSDTIAAERSEHASDDTSNHAGGPTLLRRQVTTFGRDFASTSIEIRGAAATAAGWETHTWVRLPEGWRIVAAHASRRPDQG
jgi:uncharacterized protein YceH (UPF0502 family)